MRAGPRRQLRAAPLPPAAPPTSHPLRCRRRLRHHQTCVTTVHPARREARSQQPRREGSEVTANRENSPMPGDGWLIGYGGEDRLEQEGGTVQVPITVQL